jgi:HlyD family secretion protein
LLSAATLRKPTTRYALTAATIAGLIWAGMSISANRPIPVEVISPAHNVPVRVFGLGTVEARVLSKIGFEVGATLVELKVDHGDRVSKGQILARLNSGE